MKILIIDSHKGAKSGSDNLHLSNARVLAARLNADLIWSYAGVNDEIKGGYDAIIFNHASHYSFVDYAWVEASPNARLFFISNEYNLGEPRALWIAIKRAGRTYEVIANHSADISKIVKKYVSNWHLVNINALCFEAHDVKPEGSDVVYYGSFRKDRIPSFTKFLQGKIVVSTHMKNREKFNAAGVSATYVNRLNWKNKDILKYRASLYIEDEVNHQSYNHLANRFYEAISHNVIPLFSSDCLETIRQSGYNVPPAFIVDSHEQVEDHTENMYKSFAQKYLEDWREMAADEKESVLGRIEEIVCKEF